MKPASDLPAEILQRIQFNPRTTCWEWTGSKHPAGYGRICSHRESARMAHRVVYELLIGPIPTDKQCHHTCRTKSCVNPRHLEILSPWGHSYAHRMPYQDDPRISDETLDWASDLGVCYSESQSGELRTEMTPLRRLGIIRDALEAGHWAIAAGHLHAAHQGREWHAAHCQSHSAYCEAIPISRAYEWRLRLIHRSGVTVNVGDSVQKAFQAAKALQVA